MNKLMIKLTFDGHMKTLSRIAACGLLLMLVFVTHAQGQGVRTIFLIRHADKIDDAPDANGAMYPGTGATVHQATDTRSCNQHYSTYARQNGQHYWAVVTMDSCVLPEDRAKALAINSGCLAKIGGCKSPEGILPQVFGNR